MKHFLYFLVALFVVSCTSNTIYKKPENLIPKDSMIQLLTDMYVASSARHVKNKNLQYDLNYMVLVYDKYKIDSTRFNDSNTFYTSRIEEYNDMLKEVKKRITIQNTVFEKQIKVRDSIERAKHKTTKKDTLFDRELEEELEIHDEDSLKIQQE